MKRKLTALLLSLGMLVFCLSGCALVEIANDPGSVPVAQNNNAAGSGGETDWPTGTVTVTLPYSAGGDTDTYCRALFQQVGAMFGETFVVTNLTGGSGIVAAKDIMTKKNDGYNILFTHTGAALVQEATGVADFSYTDNFANVCTVAVDRTYCFVAIAKGGQYGGYSRGWETLADLVEDAKAHPGAIRYSTVFGSTTQYVGEQLERLAGIQFDNIDVGTAAGDRMAALLGGQVDLLAVNFMNVEDYINNGDLVCLGVMSDERVKGIDFPTIAEQGYRVVSTKKYEVKLPVGTDQAIIDKLSAACKEVCETPEFAETLATYYAEPFYRDAATMSAEDRAEVEELRAAMAQ